MGEQRGVEVVLAFVIARVLARSNLMESKRDWVHPQSRFCYRSDSRHMQCWAADCPDILLNIIPVLLIIQISNTPLIMTIGTF